MLSVERLPYPPVSGNDLFAGFIRSGSPPNAYVFGTSVFGFSYAVTGKSRAPIDMHPANSLFVEDGLMMPMYNLLRRPVNLKHAVGRVGGGGMPVLHPNSSRKNKIFVNSYFFACIGIRIILK